MTASVLVVGASAAGLATAEALRRKGFDGRLTLLGAEPHLPYDRPPLSKQVLSGAWEPARARLRPDAMLSSLDAEFALGEAATGLDVGNRAVTTENGRVLGADAIVIATGIRARTLPGAAGLGGVHVLRTIEDALRLKGELAQAKRLVVVGDGVLGAEIAATATGLGPDVTLVGPQAAPMELQLGPGVAKHLAEMHTERGVRLRPGVGVAGLEERDGRVTGVRLDSGDVLTADAVVVSIGSIPVTEWLTGSGLRIDNGIVCDANCLAAEGIWAVGDVARWHHAGLGRDLRLENRTNATEQAAAVAANILGADLPYKPVPYFWTDQFDAKIQVYGLPSVDGELDVLEGDPAARRFVAAYRTEGRITGVVGWSMPKQARQHRQSLVESFA
ncbi:NAD(P)/FAD-dependent oxidoreductase [Glycomyces artemisiae]|uniref:3-phenylpropionate/trans-cinnamate dioxygenase ferredoxin reductase subunit n=1 Tax=Glycomyces artemisiae TaxID=1076443 RepID=A0A2T0UCZ4_9ACTN|nr:FAD-dependent oxidoreductase [Glycomyces artemisiae]PRY55811.1 3-phenylpropionate/trans-cinnamate dioxygenase ferredoxin reductase subunit [Glycomyces artemisiae]